MDSRTKRCLLVAASTACVAGVILIAFRQKIFTLKEMLVGGEMQDVGHSSVERLPPTPHGGALQLRWRYSWPGIDDEMRYGDVVCADLDGTGQQQIIVRTPQGASVFDGAGKLVRSFPMSDEMRTISACRSRQGIFLIGFSTWSEGVTACDRTGHRLWRYTGHGDGEDQSNPTNLAGLPLDKPVDKSDGVDWACPVDIRSPDGDAVAIGYNSGRIKLVNSQGSLLWTAENRGSAWHVGSATLKRGEPASILSSTDSVHVFNSHGRKMKEIGPATEDGAVLGADLDGDGIDEILDLGQCQGGHLSAYGADGTLRWRRQFQENIIGVERPIMVGNLWPAGRQVAVGYRDGKITVYDGSGKPLSLLQAGDDLVSFALLEHGTGQRDDLVTVNSTGIACYAWKPGAESLIPDRLLTPPPPPKEPPLIEAVLKNDGNRVAELLRSGVDPETRNTQGSQALVVAADRGFTRIASILLDAHAKVNAYSKDGDTPLLRAVGSDHPAMLRLLLAHGADPSLPYTGHTISFGTPPLVSAAMDGNTDVLRQLLDAGVSIQSTQPDGDTALYWAAAEGHIEAARLLISRGAIVDARNWYGQTPLMEAAMDGHTAVMKLLIAHGANIAARDDSLRKFYGAAQFMGDKATIGRIEKSGKMNTRHEDGMSVMDWAKVGEHREAILLLEQAGAKPL